MTEKAAPGMDFTMYDHEGVMASWVTGAESEKFVQDAFHAALRGRCPGPSSSPEEAWEAGDVVLDIGANTGFYGLLALSYGCATVFFEPQPDCVALLEKSLEANGVDPARYRIVRHPVGGAKSTGMSLEVQPNNHCEGRFPIANFEAGHADAY